MKKGIRIATVLCMCVVLVTSLSIFVSADSDQNTFIDTEYNYSCYCTIYAGSGSASATMHSTPIGTPIPDNDVRTTCILYLHDGSTTVRSANGAGGDYCNANIPNGWVTFPSEYTYATAAYNFRLNNVGRLSANKGL